MIRSLIGIVFFLITAEFTSGQNKVHLEIKSFPSYQSSNSEIFLGGSFNGWNPQDKNFQFNKDDQGNYSLDIKLANGSYQFKITRGAICIFQFSLSVPYSSSQRIQNIVLLDVEGISLT